MPSPPPKGFGPLAKSVRDLLATAFPTLAAAEMYVAFCDLVGTDREAKGETAEFVERVRSLLRDHHPQLSPDQIAEELGLVAQEMTWLEAHGERCSICHIRRKPDRALRNDHWTFEQFWQPGQGVLTLRFTDEEHMGRFCEKLVREQTFECRLDSPPAPFSAITLHLDVLGLGTEISLCARVIRVLPNHTCVCAIPQVPSGVRRSAARWRARLSQGVSVVPEPASLSKSGDVIRSAFTNERNTLTPISGLPRVATGEQVAASERGHKRPRSGLRRRGRTRRSNPPSPDAGAYDARGSLGEPSTQHPSTHPPNADPMDAARRGSQRLAPPPQEGMGSPSESNTQPVVRLNGGVPRARHTVSTEITRPSSPGSPPVRGALVERFAGAGPLGDPPALLLQAAHLDAIVALDLSTPTGRWTFTIAAGGLMDARAHPGSRPLLLDADGSVGSLRSVLGDEVIAFDMAVYEALNADQLSEGPLFQEAWAWLRDICRRLDPTRLDPTRLEHARAGEGRQRAVIDEIGAARIARLPFSSVETDFIAHLRLDSTLEDAIAASALSPAAGRALALALASGGLLRWINTQSRTDRLEAAWARLSAKSRELESGSPFELLEAHWTSDATLLRQACDATMRSLDLDFVAAEGNSTQQAVAARVRDAMIAARERLRDPLERTNERRKSVPQTEQDHIMQVLESKTEHALRAGDDAMAIDNLRRVVELAPSRRSARAQLDALTSQQSRTARQR